MNIANGNLKNDFGNIVELSEWRRKFVDDLLKEGNKNMVELAENKKVLSLTRRVNELETTLTSIYNLASSFGIARDSIMGAIELVLPLNPDDMSMPSLYNVARD